MENTSVKINNISKMELRHLIAEAVQEALTDPDFGLELNPNFIEGLKKSIKQKREGKITPLKDILKKYNKK